MNGKIPKKRKKTERNRLLGRNDQKGGKECGGFRANKRVRNFERKSCKKVLILSQAYGIVKTILVKIEFAPMHGKVHKTENPFSLGAVEITESEESRRKTRKKQSFPLHFIL